MTGTGLAARLFEPTADAGVPFGTDTNAVPERAGACEVFSDDFVQRFQRKGAIKGKLFARGIGAGRG